MHELDRMIKELRRGWCRIEDFFINVCPYVTQQNVERICRDIPGELQLRFRWLVTYQKTSGVVYTIGASNVEVLGQEFFDGLKVLRDNFAAQGTFQFGDYLLMEKDRLETLLLQWERPGVNQSKRNKFSEEKVLIDSLLKRHEPAVLEAYCQSRSMDKTED